MNIESSKRFLNVTELSEYLGMGKSTLQKLTAKKEIPHIKIGGRVLYDPRDLERWLERRRVAPREEIEKPAGGKE